MPHTSFKIPPAASSGIGINEEQEGFLSKGLSALEQLFRPQSALYAGGVSLLKGEGPFTATQEALEELWEFDRRLTFEDLMNTAGIPEFPGRGVVEFAGDFIFDPLWVVPVGPIVGRGARIAKSGIRVASDAAFSGLTSPQRTPFVRDTSSAIFKSVKSGLDSFYSKYVTAKGAVSKQAQDVVSRASKLNRKLSDAAGSFDKERSLYSKQVKRLAKREGVSEAEIRSALTAVRVGKKIKDMSLEEILAADGKFVGASFPDQTVFSVRQLEEAAHKSGEFIPSDLFRGISDEGTLDQLKDIAQKQLDRSNRLLDADAAVQANARWSRLPQSFKESLPRPAKFKEKLHREAREEIQFKSDRLDYIHNMLNPEAKEHLIRTRREFKDLGPVWTPDHTALFERTFKNTSTLELNNLSMAGRLDFVPKGMPLFIDDPNFLDAVRTYKTFEEVEVAKYFQSVIEDFGWKELKDIGPLMRNPEALAKLGLKAEDLKNIRVAQNASGEYRTLASLKDEGYHIFENRDYGRVWFPEETSKIMNKHYEVSNLPKAMETVVNGFQDLQSIWKIWTLAPFPAYHARNMVGNAYNVMLAGMHPIKFAEFSGIAGQLQHLGGGMKFLPEDVATLMTKDMGKFVEQQASNAIGLGAKAGKALQPLMKAMSRKTIKSLDEKITIGTMTKTGREWLEELHDVGAISGGIFAGEVERAAKGGLRTGRSLTSTEDVSKLRRASNEARRQVEGRPGTFVGSMAEGGKAIEANARAALYLWARTSRKHTDGLLGVANRINQGQKKVGMSKEAAADYMNLHLFDYANPDPITNVTRNLAFPFFTWTRFNVPLQARYLIQDPAKQSAILKLARNIESNASTDQSVDQRYVSEWIRQGMAIRTRRTPEGYEAYVLNNWIPLVDLAEMGLTDTSQGIDNVAKQMGRWAKNALTPLLKVPIELMGGRRFFYDRPFLPERRRFFAWNIGEKWLNTLQNVRVLETLNRFYNAPREQEMGSEVLRFFFGLKRQEIDLKKSREFAIKEFKAIVSNLEGAKARVERREHKDAADLREIERLEREIEKVKDEFRKAKY